MDKTFMRSFNYTVSFISPRIKKIIEELSETTIENIQEIRSQTSKIYNIDKNLQMIAQPMIDEANEKAKHQAEEIAKREAEKKAKSEHELEESVEAIVEYFQNNKSNLDIVKPILKEIKALGYDKPQLISDLDDAKKILELCK